MCAGMIEKDESLPTTLDAARFRLLAVIAHPDDETLAVGGTLALYTQRGVLVDVICATRGEAGEVDANILGGYSSVGARREAELRCAAQQLGVREVYFLDYRDSGMPGTADNEHPQALTMVPVDEVAARITRLIRQLRPHVVITFDPIGGYLHADHIAIHRATVKAFHDAANAQYTIDGDTTPPHQAQKLYFQTMGRTILRLISRSLRLVGLDPHRLRYSQRGAVDLATMAEADIPIHARIDTRTAAKHRANALKCYASQFGGSPVRRAILRTFVFLTGRNEVFMQAYPEASATLCERDLLNGVEIDGGS